MFSVLPTHPPDTQNPRVRSPPTIKGAKMDESATLYIHHHTIGASPIEVHTEKPLAGLIRRRVQPTQNHLRRPSGWNGQRPSVRLR